MAVKASDTNHAEDHTMRHLQLLSLIGISIFLAGCGGSGSEAKNDDKGAASGGGSGFAQKVLSLDEKSYSGGLRKSGSRKGTMSINNGGAGRGPLAKNGGTYSLEKAEHSAGTMADAFQALLMLRPAQCVYYDSNQNGKCYGMGALDLSPSLYKSVFGELEGLVDANRSGRKARWQLKCSDGTLRFVGDVIPNRLVRIEDVIPN
jgi:hypothetical protein